jgi:superfamily II DNA or RNA helicase
MFSKTTYDPYVCNIAITQNQQKFLVNQVLTQLGKFYKGKDNRRMVLNAFTGSGKTTVALKVLIPEFVKNFYPNGKRVVVFMAPRAEVVEQTYKNALKTIHKKTVNGAIIKCYNSADITDIKTKAKRGYDPEDLDGDVIVLFLTAQYFYTNYDLLTKEKAFDLVLVDEAHIMFGTINKEDTKADKGVTNNKFVAETLTKLSELVDTAVLFMTATPTNSQQMYTDLGKTHNVYLKPMPRDLLTTPFYDIIPYIDSEDTVDRGLEYFKNQCEKIGEIIKSITPDTWKIAKEFTPMYPATLVRCARRGARNGADFEENIDEIRNLCRSYGFKLMVSTSKGKEFNGYRIDSLAHGADLANKNHDKPIVIVTIDSGYAGLDVPKINNIVIGREPSGTIHNNYSQTAGRAARMKQGFINHVDAAEKIKSYDLPQEQKRLLAEYYILLSTSVVHVPVDSKLLNNDVKEFIEGDTYRENEGRKFILDTIFGNNHPNLPRGLHLSTSTSIQDDAYKQYKKDFCEACNVAPDGHTYCFHAAWQGFENILGVKISEGEMKILWPMCLHVHHMDGNHFNHDLQNLKTICPNVHAAVTMHNQDYNNRYPELRQALAKIANKKGAIATNFLAFI